MKKNDLKALKFYLKKKSKRNILIMNTKLSFKQKSFLIERRRCVKGIYRSQPVGEYFFQEFFVASLALEKIIKTLKFYFSKFHSL